MYFLSKRFTFHRHKNFYTLLRKLNCFLNIVIGSSIGVFIGFGIYKFWHFKTYPNLYAMRISSKSSSEYVSFTVLQVLTLCILLTGLLTT
ncbi:hypothetical protein DW958_22430 [Ruminococcus sp. AM46-18]|nr:hypothetical protein DW958_22430 [Ruminococcus sp. AM46-18]